MSQMVSAAADRTDDVAAVRERIKCLEAELHAIREELKCANQKQQDSNEQLLQQSRALELANTSLLRSRSDMQGFAYSVSHDLREPVRMILSFSQLLQKRYGSLPGANEKDSIYMGHILAGGRRLTAMMDSLLAYSQVDSERGEMKPVPLGRILQQAWHHLESTGSASDVQMTAGPMPVVWGDETQLSSVLTELLKNALKFRSGAPLELAVQASWLGAGRWRIELSDNGIGIPAEQCEAVFQMFKTLHHRDAYPGLGAGLAIVRRIIERHGGEVQARPGRPAGTIISFTLQGSAEAAALTVA